MIRNFFSALFYKIPRNYVKLSLWFFFRKWQVNGEKNIPANAAIIFVVNHQNAFQDAILVACSTYDEPWFLTRAGVFNSKITRAIFRAFHMMPVYRFRDGVKGLRNNDATIRQCVALLKDRKSILIFGEGDQSMRYKLRPLQKGFARIALTVQQENDWNLPLYIVPVGVQYDHYYNFRSRVLVNYGKAIPVDTSYKGLQEREFYDTLLDKTRKALIPLMLHIDIDGYESVENYLRGHRTKEDLVEQLQYDQKIVEEWKINPKTSGDTTSKNYLLLAVGFPLHLYVLINNFLPYSLVRWILKKYVTLEFQGSLKFGLGMVATPLFYLLQSVVVHNIFSDWRVTLAYLLTLPFLSIWSVDLFKSSVGKPR